jgi:hypothetical protein
MSTLYTPVTLAAQAAHMPELDGLSQSDQEWSIGGISIPKSDRANPDLTKPPSYRRGWTFPLPADLRAVAIRFRRAAGRGVAIVFRTAGEEYLAGWFRGERYQEAERAVGILNDAIDSAWQRWREASPADAGRAASTDLGTSETPVDDGARRLLTFEQGSEHAPDAPWGLETIEISSEGRLVYEHRNRGKNRSLHGRVDAERCRRIIAALRSTTFPEPPQLQFVPGASMLGISLDNPAGKVCIDYFDGQQYLGYREVIRELSALNTALRTDDRAVLEQWEFEENAP